MTNVFINLIYVFIHLEHDFLVGFHSAVKLIPYHTGSVLLEVRLFYLLYKIRCKISSALKGQGSPMLGGHLGLEVLTLNEQQMRMIKIIHTMVMDVG